ncbi:tyrosinase [Hirsutella rhossiliensis]|uniref:tyrosinase n=1 Tax=Hirsutella rhossiliensis TaxID=111463 RepID=A0A9P8SF21_9HYPO|nr:tyrosinase [Hirsutella rhossiliensis]KAH0960286.1 tyrosinase [Hirsutella rhossiliensis]
MLIKTVACLFLGSTVLAQRTTTSDPYAVTGARVRSGSVPIRRNINDLQAEAGPQWDLYIQALSSMIGASPSDPLSYFQIEGIHGSPPFEWNNTGRSNSSGRAGYCPHGDALFLPWHRPYLALFEQVLVDNARKIAAGYRGATRNRYLQAADALRAPYWDWATTSDVPPSTVPRSVTINTPKGRRQVRNPLSGFTFPQQAVRGQFGRFSPSPRAAIARCPAPNSYPNSANRMMASNDLKELVFSAFTYSKTFEEFSTTSTGGVSLEQAHNLVHNSAACGQQFSSPSYAAYDPLFMLHYANVDRLWALWQAANPNQAGLSRSYVGGSRFATPQGTTIRPTSPLAPFYGPGKQQLTANGVLSTHQFGYTDPNPDKDLEERRRRAVSIINDLYKGKDHEEKRKVYLAHISLRAEDVERPSTIKVFLCDQFVGDIAVMAEPSKGPVNAAIPLNPAIGACERAGVSKEEMRESISVTITTADGRDVPLAKIKTISMEVEDFIEEPSATSGELPKISNRHKVPGHLKQHMPEKPKDGGHGKDDGGKSGGHVDDGGKPGGHVVDAGKPGGHGIISDVLGSVKSDLVPNLI